jgi:hypothetical protein
MKLQKKCEHTEQVAVINWAKLNEGKYPELRNLFAIPNGGARHLVVAKKLKAEGVKAGVPDLFLPCSKLPTPDEFFIGSGDYIELSDEVFFGLFIEMKFGKNKPKDNQRDWIKRLRDENYKVAVCYSFEEARDEILNYLRECQ